MDDVTNYELDLLVYAHYIGYIQIGGAIPSIIREEGVPSFSLYEGSKGKIYWKDHGTGDGGDALDLICHIECVELGPAIHTYRKITNDNEEAEKRVLNVKRKISQPPTLVMKAYFDLSHLKYYSMFGIGASNMIEQNIYALDKLVYGDYVSYESTITEPKFIFLYPNQDEDAWKMYNPLASEKKDKWRSGNISGVIDNWHRLDDTGECYNIHTGKKDGQCYELASGDRNWGAPPAEGNFRAIIERLPEIKKRFKRGLIWNDLDDRGKEMAEKLSMATGFPIYGQHLNPIVREGRNLKDLGDIREVLGFQALQKWVSGVH